MAGVGLASVGDETQLYYTVDAAVGPGCPNRRDDVLLVQYFLRAIFQGVGEAHSEPIVASGVADGATFQGILGFQNFGRNRGWNIATDGRVDAPAGRQNWGPASGAPYTIFYLNVGFAIARPNDWPDVGRAADCPPELRRALRAPGFVNSLARGRP